MRAVLRKLHSPDAPDLRLFHPADPTCFSVFIQAMIGPDDQEAAESFDIVVCTPRWFIENCNIHDVILGRHHLIVFEFDFQELWNAIHSYCDSISGASWPEIAAKIGRLGKWEFEDYSEYPIVS